MVNLPPRSRRRIARLEFTLYYFRRVVGCCPLATFVGWCCPCQPVQVAAGFLEFCICGPGQHLVPAVGADDLEWALFEVHRAAPPPWSLQPATSTAGCGIRSGSP